MAKNKGGRRNVAHGITLDEFISQVYLPCAKINKRSWQYDERVSRRHLSPKFGNLPIKSITACEITNWLHSLAQKDFAPASCNRFLAVFRTICAVAERQGYLEQGKSPCRSVQPLKVREQSSRYLSDEEGGRLMAYLKASTRPEAVALRLLLLTGARKSEILQARWENIDIKRQILLAPISKSGKPRHIALSKAALEAILSLQGRADNPWLFPGRDGNKPISDIYIFWNKARQELGLKNVRIHDLRHTFASFLVNSGRSLYEVQQALGHSDPRVTMRYAHLNNSRLLQAVEAVSSCLNK